MLKSKEVLTRVFKKPLGPSPTTRNKHILSQPTAPTIGSSGKVFFFLIKLSGYKCINFPLESYLIAGLIYISKYSTGKYRLSSVPSEVSSKVQAIYFGSKPERRLALSCQVYKSFNWALHSHCFITVPETR